ncbi:C45 family autoproteolytic acyltransferase/hydolase [Natronospora cellulosivora (SeqCode)]
MKKKLLCLCFILISVSLVACDNNGIGDIIGENTRYSLNIEVEGFGNVITESGEYNANTTVVIDIDPEEDSFFDEWAGPNSNDVQYRDGKWKILMDGDKEITAVFDLKVNAVRIEEKDGYYMVELNYDSGLSHYEIGEIYGKKLVKKINGFEEKIDSYIGTLLDLGVTEEQMFMAVEIIKDQIQEEYKEEIKGIASQLSGNVDQLNDGKLSLNELLIFNLFGDIFAADSCSAISVFGDLSEDASTILGRNLDWYVGNDEITSLHAVKKYRNGDQSFVSIATLGYMGVITGFNNNQIFGAHLISSTFQDTLEVGTRSFAMDLRYALENANSIDGVADYTNNNNYSVSHLVYLADPEISKVLENYTGNNEQNQLRTNACQIRAEWNIPDSIAAVNAFMLDSKPDNFSNLSGNTARWESIVKELSAKGDNISFKDIKDIITYFSGDTPGRHSDGDLYSVNGNNITTQTIVFKPETLELEVFFKPVGDLPANPNFEKIDISFD